MEASNELITYIKRAEGFSDTAYLDNAGVWTIGYGHTRGVARGMRITQKQVELFLIGDLANCEHFVNKLGICKTQGQFDALTDFCFNLGNVELAKSTLLKKIKRGANEKEIRDEFGRWVYCDGVRLNGLIKRRKWEADRYFSKK